MHKTLAAWVAVLGLGVLASGTASAQQAAFEPSPDCLISAAYAAPRFEHSAPGFLWRDGEFSLEGAILANLGLGLRPALCVAAPKWMYARYANDRALAASRRAAAEAKIAQREALMNSIEELGRARFKPAYRPPASEPRCYLTDEKMETCFYN